MIVKGIFKNKYNELKNEDLKRLIGNINVNAFKPRFKNIISKKNIQDNYREIERRIANVDEGFINFFFNKCEITHFVIDDVSEAFQFFDSQNARGKDGGNLTIRLKHFI